MKVLILLSIAAIAFGQDCGVNQHFTDCGTSCPLTCENYKNPPKFCNLMCNIGCECDEGFVRTKDGRCVAPQQCQEEAQKCGVNQHFTECGTSCPLTCENYKNPPKFCNYMCNIGCECDKGFVRTKDGRCVEPQKCPQGARPIETNCDDNPDSGVCMGYFPMWFYDKKTGQCREFVFGGCAGNGNRYKTKDECLANCEGLTVKQSAPSDCELPEEPGVCRGYFVKYFYDIKAGTCKTFVYGGCGGNENNFDTVEDCQKTCAPQSAPDACLQEKKVGPCRAAFRKYFYNKETGKCELFYYGGCQGNSNRFNTQEDCEAICGVKSSAPSACQEEKVVGPCRAAFRRYFFNKQTGKCEQFTYGGCHGNSNNFNSQEDCEAVCLA